MYFGYNRLILPRVYNDIYKNACIECNVWNING